MSITGSGNFARGRKWRARCLCRYRFSETIERNSEIIFHRRRMLASLWITFFGLTLVRDLSNIVRKMVFASFYLFKDLKTRIFPSMSYYDLQNLCHQTTSDLSYALNYSQLYVLQYQKFVRTNFGKTFRKSFKESRQVSCHLSRKTYPRNSPHPVDT